MFFVFEKAFFLAKNAPGRAAPNRRPSLAGDAPKPSFSSKSNENQQKPNNRPPVNHENDPPNLSLHAPPEEVEQTQGLIDTRSCVTDLDKYEAMREKDGMDEDAMGAKAMESRKKRRLQDSWVPSPSKKRNKGYVNRKKRRLQDLWVPSSSKKGKKGYVNIPIGPA